LNKGSGFLEEFERFVILFCYSTFCSSGKRKILTLPRNVIPRVRGHGATRRRVDSSAAFVRIMISGQDCNGMQTARCSTRWTGVKHSTM
jgi:hypothetical protein